MRRLPCYLLLDVSSSMMGEPVKALQSGLEFLVNALKKDPYATESVFLSVIAFATVPRQIVPLTEIAEFVPPLLDAGGETSLDAALGLVADCAERETVKSTPEHKGDGKPLVFIMLGSNPTYVLDEGLAKFKRYHWGNFAVCCLGAECDRQLLRMVFDDERTGTSHVVDLDSPESNSLSSFFRWISASVTLSSKHIETGDDSFFIDEPPPPPKITLV